MDSSDSNDTNEIYIIKLEKHVIELISENSDLKAKILSLSNENEKLKSRILKYENPHTPPSSQKMGNINMGKTQEEQIPGKRGAPIGHRGATRVMEHPDEIIHVSMDKCPKCNSSLGSPIKTEKKTILDIPPPQDVKVTEYDLDIYRCNNCGSEVKSRHKDCPQKGDMGIYLLNYITMLKYNMRGVIRKVQEFISVNNNLDLSTKGIEDALLRVGEACKVEYDAIGKRISKSKWVHIDETGFHVDGKKYWLWSFRSAENDILVVITDSRGRDVVKETMGENFHGPVIVDGWRAYSYLTIIQRCWAHLIREVDAFKDNKQGKELSDEIHAMFKELKESLKSEDMDYRMSMKNAFDKKIDDIANRYGEYRELKKPVKYIINGLGSWFTCLLYPGMEPTNNLAEQSIREHVVIRKIIGTFRSKSGSQNYQYISSLMSTWNFQKKNMFVEMDKILRKELCGIG